MFKLIINELKNKTNYFFLSIVICVVLSVAMPFLLVGSEKFFRAVSMLVAILISMVSAFTDYSFMHNDGKLAYYLSKPMSFKKSVNIKLISNIVFAIVLFLLTYMITQISGSLFYGKGFSHYTRDMNMFRNVSFAWLIVIMFTVTLSCVLTGNTVVAVVSTIFNFAFPAIIYLILNYIFSIVESMNVGIDSYIMNEMLQRYIYPIDKIYFLDYYNKLDFRYIIQIIAICALIYLLILFAIRKRKNENTGYYIVHAGYKYFISLFLSLVLPIIMTLFSGFRYEQMIKVLILLSALSYYVIISIFNRSFRVTKSAIKIYIPFIVIISLIITATSLVVKYRGEYIPDAEDIKIALITSNRRIYDKESDQYVNIYSADLDKLENTSNVAAFKDKENISDVILLHKELLENKNTGYYNSIHIIYVLNNDLRIVRRFNLQEDSSNNLNNNILDIVKKLVNTDEFNKSKYYQIYNDEFVNNFNYDSVRIYNTNSGEETESINFDYSKFTEEIKEDLENAKTDRMLALKILLLIDYDFNQIFYGKTDKYSDKPLDYYGVIFGQGSGRRIEFIGVPELFTNAYQYIDSFKITE